MNIALFSETYYPEINGVANSVFLLKQELELRGHQVYVFTTTTPGEPEYEHNVFRVPSLPCILITERRVGLFYQPKLASVIKKLDLDIIHTHTEFSLGIFGRIMAKELHLPVVHTYHTIYEDYTHYLTHFKRLDKRAKSFARTYSKVCCNTVSEVIVPTQKVKDLLETYSVHKTIHVVPTGIDLTKFDPKKTSIQKRNEMRSKFGLQESDYVLVYVGRVSKEKNLAEIIEVLPEYSLQRKNVKLLIVGGGPEKENLERLVHDIQLEHIVVFAGEQPWDEIAAYYHLGDVFVSASTSETQGLTYIEAMASGLPVVAKKDPCLDGILQEGFNGYQFTNATECRSGLEAIYQGMLQSADYKERSLKQVIPYSTKQFAMDVEAVYEQVLQLNESKSLELGATLESEQRKGVKTDGTR